ncbi:kinase-like domain-containing protein [Dissophora ornata]|nr:kinase-like domain-containing protein [Dissophora ornata]
MYVLNTLEILHENPYTGDKISKARVIPIDPAILSTASNSSSINREQRGDITLLPEQHTSTNTATSTIDSKTSQPEVRRIDDGNGYEEKKEISQLLPRLIAIKYLSDFRITREGRGRTHGSPNGSIGWGDSSDDENSDSSIDQGDHEEETECGVGNGSGEKHQGPFLGQARVPERIRFGVKAKREIRTLKAAQGHPNVMPFLGFTGPAAPNPFRASKERQKQKDVPHSSGSYGGDLLAEPAPLLQEVVQLNRTKSTTYESLGGALLGPVLGRSLFQEDQTQNQELSASLHTETFVSAVPRELFPPLRNSGFNSDYDSDLDGSLYDDDDDDDEETFGAEQNPATMTAQDWNRIFARQSRMGGILLPYTPISLTDLIHTGWTRTRPLLVETCMRQILGGLAWIHDKAGLIHRDISSGNIMVMVGRSEFGEGFGEEGSGRGFVRCLISDFGCATFHRPTAAEGEAAAEEGNPETAGSSNASDQQPDYYSSQPYKQGLTFEVGTRAYRAPELLFSSGTYTSAIDIWSAGVLFAEMYLGKKLFEADSDIGQVCAIVKVLGTPTEENWPEYPTMPDYGKLMFQALETNPLSNILLARPSTATTSSGDPMNHSDASPISPEAFALIERMIMYSGAARPSAQEALGFKDRYLDRTKQLEDKCIASGNAVGEHEYNQSMEEYQKQCMLDEGQILEAKRRLQDDGSDDGDEGPSFGFQFFGGGGGGSDLEEDPRHLVFDDIGEEEEEEEEEEWGLDTVERNRLQEWTEVEMRRHHEHGDVNEEARDDGYGGQGRAVKRHRTVSEGGDEG